MRDLRARKNAKVLSAIARFKECILDFGDSFGDIIDGSATKIDLLDLEIGEGGRVVCVDEDSIVEVDIIKVNGVV